MNKPNGWDEAQAITEEYRALPAGGYVCKIIKAELATSRGGAEMLRILFDIAEGEYTDYFTQRYRQRRKQSEGATWPAAGIYYQLTQGDHMGRFKGLIQNLVESNPGYRWDWNETGLAGKRFGGKMREEEYIGSDGKRHVSTKCIAIRPVEGITDIEPPERKTLDPQGGYGAPPDEDIPF